MTLIRNWMSVSLTDVCNFVGGTQPPKSTFSSSPLERYIRLVQIQDFERDDRAVYVPDTKNLKKFTTNDIMIARYGASLGRILTGLNGAYNVALVKAVPDESRLCREFLYFLLVSEPFQEFLKNIGSRAAQAGFNRDDLSRFTFALPPLSEQKRIADILDKADAIRRKRQEALKFRNHFLTSTFLDMFGDPATNPKKLPLRELSEFYVTPKDGTKCGPFGGALKKEEYTSTGVPVWNMDNISDDGSLVPNIRLWISQEKYEDLSSYSVKDGDVIISRAGTVGKMCVVRAGPKESIISTNLIRLRLNSSLIPEFFVSLMVLFKGRAGRLKTGPDGAFTHMSTGVLDKITIPYPTVSAQGDYVSIMERMDRSTHRLTTAVTEADRLFNSLAQRAFKGEL